MRKNYNIECLMGSTLIVVYQLRKVNGYESYM